MTFRRFFIGICILVVALALVYKLGFESGKEALQDNLDQIEFSVDELGLRNAELQNRLDSVLEAYGLTEEPEPVITIEDFSGCALDRNIDQDGLRKFLLDRGFLRELRIMVFPSAFPLGSVLVVGSFGETSYGARITLVSNVGFERFDEVVDHEFGHLDQRLKVTDQVWYNQTSEESEEYAESFAADQDLLLVTYNIPTLTDTEDGSSHESIFYRSDSGTPNLYIFDENNPDDDVTAIVDGEVRTAKPWDSEGWHIIEDVHTTFADLVIHDGHCAFLEST